MRDGSTVKRVSIILPAYNRGHVIATAIQSVLDQTFSHFELLVVDDGSTDDTAAVVNNFSDDRIKYIPVKHGGVSRARNHALKIMGGDYVAFIDSDDVYLPKKLEAQVSFLEAHPKFHVAYSPYIEKFKGNEKLHKCDNGNGNVFCKLFKNSFVNVNSILIRKDAAEAVGGFPENFTTLEDFDFFLRLADRFLWGFVDEVSSEYRMAERNQSHDTDNYLHYLEYVKSAPEKFETLKKNPAVYRWKYGKVLYGLGKSHMRAGRLEEAEKTIAEALKHRWQPDVLLTLYKCKKKLR